MCGISGIISGRGQVSNPLKILDMGSVLQHRGPDFLGHYISPQGNVVFSHRRLSLVGLDSRSTVITIPKKDNPAHEIAIVFNGEIYNFRELKKFFAEKGYVSVSPSDFEVIIFAYEEWGERCVDHLIGEFAFVLYDAETGKVFMARDRTGVRPLFYAHVGGEFVFASEPKALLKYPGVSHDINRSSVAEYLLMSHAFAAGNLNDQSSFYSAVQQFPAAHYAFLRDNELTFTRYWDVPIDGQQVSDDPVASIRDAVTKSVRDRIPDELPVAVALSGGLDSSVVAAIAVQTKPKSEVVGFCVRYSGDKNDDLLYATKVAEHLGIRLEGAVVTPQTMTEYINRCIVASDGPVDSIRRIGMLANYEAIRAAGFKVALIGEGADEFNLGYYHTFPGLKRDVEVCSSETTLRVAFLARVQYVREFFTEEFLRSISFDMIVDDIIAQYYSGCPSKEPLKRMQYFYARRFMQYLEDGNDRAAMASSVEARVPFVDPDVVRVSLAVPQDMNVTDDSEKMVLRRAFEDVLPKEVVYRRKSAFPANEDLESYRRLSREFHGCISTAQRPTWDMLRRERFEQIAEQFDARIEELQESGTNGKSLVSWLPLSEPVTLRVNHVFSLLTLLRWIDLYKLSFEKKS